MLRRSDFKKAPSGAGIYFFRDSRGRIIYVGKAQNLKLRLLSYADFGRAEIRKHKMLKEAMTIEWHELSSDIEALIEEAIAIKQHRPRYNIVFRDDKQYFFVGFSRGRFPRIILTHQRIKEFDLIGPFTDGGSLKSVLGSLRRIFPYCICKEKHKRPCVRSEIGRCLEICCLKNPPENDQREKIYKKNIRAIKNVLRGKRQDVLKSLEREMKEFSKKQNFEEAKKRHDQIHALENIFRHRHIIRRELNPERAKALLLAKDILGLPDIPIRIEGYDISNLQGTNAVGSMVVFEEGEPKKSDYRLFKIRLKNTPDDTAMHREVLSRRLKHEEWPLPDLILIDGGLGQWNATKKVLNNFELNTPLASLAKKEEELWLGKNKKIQLKKMPVSLLHLFQHIRNESHRFAINFHRNSRSKNLF
ncbi:GIY-YIG nuclease family protein [Candidatus Giovannonibacteria bacterium]|nr:GIY-YIG nuclease family protein [Candidatus Giovannonibacteria bacterium]